MTTPADPAPSSEAEAHATTDVHRAADSVARALEFALYAPIGAAALVADVAPDLVQTVVARGRAEVEVRQEQVAGRIRHAKGAGEVAWAFGVPMLRRKVEDRIASLRTSIESRGAQPEKSTRVAASSPLVVPSPARRPVAANGAPSTTAATNGNRRAHRDDAGVNTVDPDTLAIPGYDALSASQVVERLAGLSSDELAAVRDYETGHRRRRTILGKIEQLS